MKKFQKVDAVDIENPIRIFLAGAKFREKPVNDNTPIQI